MTASTLRRLHDIGETVARADDDVRGRKVLDNIGMPARATDGNAGVVDDILVTKEGVPRFVVVMNKGVFGSDVVLPIDQALVDGNVVQLSLTKAQVSSSERYDEMRHGEGAGLFSASASLYDRQDNWTEDGVSTFKG